MTRRKPMGLAKLLAFQNDLQRFQATAVYSNQQLTPEDRQKSNLAISEVNGLINQAISSQIPW